MPRLRVTYALVALNFLVFMAMLLSGAGLWHSPNGVQLAWGANFGPATQDGQWWRLGSALFLHFGLLHLALNMWALWDGGQWVERMYGPLRFAVIYFAAGLMGNLLSLVVHAGQGVSGGASGAIFGIYGALLSYLLCERSRIQHGEFRWLFWGALGFSGATIVFGLLVPGIDNAAHIGGLLTGLLSGYLLLKRTADQVLITQRGRWLSLGLLLTVTGLLIYLIPQPSYRWSEEIKAREEISAFLHDDVAISDSWQKLLLEGKQGRLSFDELAEKIDMVVAEHYEESFDELSALPHKEVLPSSPALEKLIRYAERRRDASRALADGLRNRDQLQIKKALEQARPTE